MKDNSLHSIQKVLVEVNTSSLKTGNYFKNNFSKYLNEMILPLFEEELNRINIKTGNYDIRLDELSLHINLKSLEEFTTIKNAIVPKASKQIKKLIAKELLGVSEKEIVVQEVQKNQKELLKEFLINGKFPWWFSEAQIDLETIQLKDFIRISELKNEQLRTRLIHQFEDFQLLNLVEDMLSKITNSTLKARLENLILKAYKEIHLNRSFTVHQRTEIWNAIFLLFVEIASETSLRKNILKILKVTKITTITSETELSKESEEAILKTLDFENTLANTIKIKKETENIEELYGAFKNTSEKEMLKIDIESSDKIFEDQFKNIINQFGQITKILDNLKERETTIEDKEICKAASLFLKLFFEASSKSNITSDSEKLIAIFKEKTTFSIDSVLQLVSFILNSKKQNSLPFSSTYRNEFYRITKVLTNLNASIQNSKPINEFVYNNKIKEDFKGETTKLVHQFSEILIPLKGIENQQKIIVDNSNSIKKVGFSLIQLLLNTFSNHDFILKYKELEDKFNQETTVKLSAIVHLIDAILELKDHGVFDVYNNQKIKFYKIITQLAKFERVLKSSEFLKEFDFPKNIKMETTLKHELHALEYQDQDQERNSVHVKRRISDMNVDEVTYVNNAGLVLIHPFLKYFFVNIGMYNEESKTLTDPIKAAHLLHYIATKQENVFENKMTFEKILCGIPLDQSINRFVEISKKEKEEVENMLKAMLNNWEKMEHASTDLLRNEFLQREAKLLIKGEQTTLKIAYKTQDILLNKLNWNTAIIKLPWLDFILNVAWC